MNTQSVVNQEHETKKTISSNSKMTMFARYLVHKQLKSLHTGCLKIEEGDNTFTFRMIIKW